MPEQDKTGPLGYGPRTGQRFGPCEVGMDHGRCGCGFSYGRFGGLYPSQPKLTKKDETTMLEVELEEIKARLNELKK